MQPEKRRGGLRAKLLVVLVGVAIFVPVTVWRSNVALDELAAENGPLLEYDCRERLSYVPLNRVAAALPRMNVHRYDRIPELPAVRLGTLHLVAPVAILEGLDVGRPMEYRCLRVAKERLGANAWVFEEIERDARFPEGFGRLAEPVYLLHAGRIPAWLRGEFGQSACALSDVFAGTRAHEAGLRAGDLLVALDGRPLPSEDPCRVSEAVDAGDPRIPVVLRVVRDQVPFDLSVRPPAPGERFGCRYRRLPILEEPALAALPRVLEPG